MEKKKVFGFKAYNFGDIGNRVKNVLKKQPVPDERLDTSDGITNWENNSNSTQNNFPQQLLQDVQNSPVGNAAMDVWIDFVEGGGFVDPNAGSMKVNKSQDLNDLHAKLSADLSLMWGFAVHIAYTAEGMPIEYNHLPFESTRLGLLDDNGVAKDIKYNPYFGIPQSYDKKYTKWYYTYNPNPQDVVAEIIAHNESLKDESNKDITEPYPGQVFWFGVERPLSRVYPTPFYYAGINWFRVDKEIPQFHERNIKNNFLLSVILNVFGSPDTEAGEKDPEGNFTSTAGEQLDLQMRNFNAKYGGVFVNWINREEEKATLEKFPTNANDQLFITLDNQATDKISIATKVPRILIGIQTAGKLGDTQEIINAIGLMQGRTHWMRELLSQQYKKIFTGFSNAESIEDWTIKTVNPADVIPDWVIAELTPEERRGIIEENYNIELQEQQQFEDTQQQSSTSPEQLAAQANLKGSVGGVQGILSIQQGVSAGLTSRESAIEVLQLIYGFTPDEAERLLGTPKEGAATTPELKIS